MIVSPTPIKSPRRTNLRIPLQSTPQLRAPADHVKVVQSDGSVQPRKLYHGARVLVEPLLGV